VGKKENQAPSNCRRYMRLATGPVVCPRDMRLYPNGALAAHIMGGASYGREGRATPPRLSALPVLRNTFDAQLSA